jgi:hypothetical protein
LRSPAGRVDDQVRRLDRFLLGAGGADPDAGGAAVLAFALLDLDAGGGRLIAAGDVAEAGQALADDRLEEGSALHEDDEIGAVVPGLQKP